MTSSPTSEREPDALPGVADILDAAARLAPYATRTPVLESPTLNALVGGRIVVKAEPLQRTGSFKFRGAYNRISRLSPEERRRGVVTYSSGNHAQGVAHAAGLCGTRAVVVMPRDAPAVKIAGTRALGAEVVLYDRDGESREEIGERIVAERGSVLVPPYDDPLIIAGQGTVGLELAEQLGERALVPDAVLAPCGGGGLIAGTSLALAARLPGTPVYSVEPEGFDDTARSLAAGRRLANRPGPSSICDALLAPTPGRITFAVNRRTLAGGLAVGDDAVRRAMAAAFTHLKLVVEPGGAVALAAVLAGVFDARGRTVAVIVSGGNVDPDRYIEVVARAGSDQGPTRNT